MKNTYLLLTGLLGATSAQAQQAWQPFRPGQTYQYSETATLGDTTHVFQLGAGVPAVTANGDSLFHFSSRAERLNAAVGTCGRFERMRPNNLFGATLRSQVGGGFVLAAANGRSLTLRPRAALGQPWPTGLPGLTAQVTARTLGTVLGAADSVATLALSDGQTLHLSKRHGLLDGPSLDSYLSGQRRALTLTALPRQRLGTSRMGARAAYDFQPGDVFQYHGTSSNIFSAILCGESWTQDSVLTRTVSRGGDSLIYTLLTRQKSQHYGSPGNPFCGSLSGTSITPPTVRTLVVSDALATNDAQHLTLNYDTHSLSSVAYNSTRFVGRTEWTQQNRAACAQSSPDSLVLTIIPDGGGQQVFVAGLGRTQQASGGITEDLTYYRKGSQTWGTPFQSGFFLAARLGRSAASTAAFPNPFGAALTAQFTLGRSQKVVAELRDILGRPAATLPATAFGAGSQHLDIATANLPAGIYTLHLLFESEGSSEVLRVVKAQ